MNKLDKKNILIYWGSRTFIEVIAPLLPQIGRNFNIYLYLSDYSTPVGIIEFLNSLKNSGGVMNYYITPHQSKILGNILYLKKFI